MKSPTTRIAGSGLQEQVRAGLERARAQGKRLGRPMVPASTERAIRAERKSGKGIRKIARGLGVWVSVVRRVVAADSASLRKHQYHPRCVEKSSGSSGSRVFPRNSIPLTRVRIRGIE